MLTKVLTFSDNIYALHTAAEGLWIGHQGGLAFFDPRALPPRKWTTADGLPAHPALHVATDGDRVAVATPNGVAWTDDLRALLRASESAAPRPLWKRGLMHPEGAGAYINGVAFVHGRIHAATGGGRLYREGARGFELVQLPLRQARLVRLQALPSPKKSLRLLVVTNNSGVLLLATGGQAEPSLYQWSEGEGLASRYVTSMALVGEHVVVAVHGCVQVAPVRLLVDDPEALKQWGRIHLAEIAGPAEHNRIPALCEHGGFLYAGTTAGLYRVPLADLAVAASEGIAAERVDDTAVRQLASYRGELYAVHAGGLGRFAEGGSASAPAEVDKGAGSLRERLFRGRFGRASEPVPAPAVEGISRRWRIAPETRWRLSGAEPECRSALAIAASPEGLAVGGEAGRVAVLHAGRWTTEIVARLRRPPEVHALAWDPENATYWAATRYGLYQRDTRGRWHRDLAFPGRSVHALVVWGGSVAAVGSAGLHLYVQNEWTEIGLHDEPAQLFAAAAGETALALAGRPGSPFQIWRAGAARPEPVAVPVGRANCMAWGESGELWLGADRGLVRWDGARAESSAWNDERRDHVTALLAYRGRLFVGSQAGLWTAPLEKLQGAAGSDLEARGERFGLLEGLPDAHVTALVVHDSSVWVGTQGGLVLFS